MKDCHWLDLIGLKCVIINKTPLNVDWLNTLLTSIDKILCFECSALPWFKQQPSLQVRSRFQTLYQQFSDCLYKNNNFDPISKIASLGIIISRCKYNNNKKGFYFLESYEQRSISPIDTFCFHHVQWFYVWPTLKPASYTH